MEIEQPQKPSSMGAPTNVVQGAVIRPDFAPREELNFGAVAQCTKPGIPLVRGRSENNGDVTRPSDSYAARCKNDLPSHCSRTMYFDSQSGHAEEPDLCPRLERIVCTLGAAEVTCSISLAARAAAIDR